MMSGAASRTSVARRASSRAQVLRPYISHQCRSIQISAPPTTEARPEGDAFGSTDGASRDASDARFEVLGSPYSLLSVSLSASQKLYTRRGTLVSVAGKLENAQSTLSILSPLRRLPVGVPFLYQRVTSTSPITALIGSRSANTTFSLLHLDGTTDWVVARRNALLAWTGHTLALTPLLQRSLLTSPLHWGATHLTGRGLVALSAPGQTYRMELGAGEEIVLHPSHVVAYSLGRNPPPQPFRLRTAPRLMVPGFSVTLSDLVPASALESMGSMVPERLARFLRAMRETETFKFLVKMAHEVRTTVRRTVFGDSLFLRFGGPAMLVISSRGVRVNDVLSREQVDEIASVGMGATEQAVEKALAGNEKKVEGLKGKEEAAGKSVEAKPAAIHVAKVGKDGKVTFEDRKDLNDFVR